MANQIKIVRFEGDGGDVNIPIGFVPHLSRLVNITPTNPMIYETFRLMEEYEASGSKEGYQINGADGIVTKRSDSQGIIAYDTAAQLPTVTQWTEAVGNAATARSATARGTLVKATVGAVDQDGAVVDRSAIFECTTDGTSAATEPVWNTVPDGITTDGTTKWQIVTDKALGRVGYKGVTIASEIASNSNFFYAEFVEADVETDLGDTDGWIGGVQGG
jgi:hypothetical protein